MDAHYKHLQFYPERKWELGMGKAYVYPILQKKVRSEK
jgi:hypothetical protein